MPLPRFGRMVGSSLAWRGQPWLSLVQVVPQPLPDETLWLFKQHKSHSSRDSSQPKSPANPMQEVSGSDHTRVSWAQ